MQEKMLFFIQKKTLHILRSLSSVDLIATKSFFKRKKRNFMFLLFKFDIWLPYGSGSSSSRDMFESPLLPCYMHASVAAAATAAQ
jgi:hypothetical protein